MTENLQSDIMSQIDELFTNQKFGEGIKLIDQNLDINTSDPIFQTQLLHKKSRGLFHTKDFLQGIKAIEDELSILETLKDTKSDVAEAYIVKAYHLHMLKRYDEALEFYKNAQETYLKVSDPNPSKLDQFTYSIANILFHYLGQYESALEYYIQARDYAIRFNREDREGFFETHLGMAKLELGLHDEAMSHCLRAKEILKEDDPSYLFNILEMVKIFFAKGQIQESMQTLLPILNQTINNPDPFAYSVVRFIVAEALSTGKFPEELRSDFVKEFLEEFTSESLLDHGLKLLEEDNRDRHFAEGLCLKAKLGYGDPKNLMSKAKLMAIEVNEVPLTNMIKETAERLELNYDDLG